VTNVAARTADLLMMPLCILPSLPLRGRVRRALPGAHMKLREEHILLRR
jgi:hypothetical protein